MSTNPSLEPIMAANGQLVAPDQAFFNDLSNEVSDKGFLVTSTEELFQWARTGSLWWMTLAWLVVLWK
jgi:NADH-quinone oxidoreductase subunit B